MSPASSTATDETDTRERPSAGLGTHPLAGGEGVAEQAVRDRAGGALHQRELVGALDLPLDLGLAHDHRVQPGGDAEQVADRVASRGRSRDSR